MLQNPAEPTTFQFQYFKGFDQASLALDQPVTLVIGRNGAGKSNLLEGIALLGELASGRPLFEVNNGTSGAVRGGLSGCPSLGERYFILGCTQGDLQYRLVVRPEVKQVEAESLQISDRILFQAEDGNFRNRTIEVRCNPDPAKPMPEDTQKQPLSSERSVLSVYPHNFLPSTPSLSQDLTMQKVGALKQRLKDICFLSPQPSAMRKYQRVGLSLGPRTIAWDAANLSALLYDLHTGSAADQETLRAICREVQALPEEPFGDIGFLQTPTDEVMLGFWPNQTAATADPDEVPPLHAGLLSDGTLCYLALITALATLPTGTLLLIEDFDAGLHPSRMARLLTILSERCKERKISAVVTTHSPAVLNGLSSEHLKGVVVCYRAPGAQSGQLCPLLEVPEADILLERGHLGDIVTKQVLEEHLAPRFSELRKQQCLDLLESIP